MFSAEPVVDTIYLSPGVGIYSSRERLRNAVLALGSDSSGDGKSKSGSYPFKDGLGSTIGVIVYYSQFSELYSELNGAG